MPFTNQEIQSLNLTALFSNLSNSMVSEGLREFVQSVDLARSASPQVVPKMLPGGPGMLEMEGGQIMRTNV